MVHLSCTRLLDSWLAVLWTLRKRLRGLHLVFPLAPGRLACTILRNWLRRSALRTCYWDQTSFRRHDCPAELHIFCHWFYQVLNSWSCSCFDLSVFFCSKDQMNWPHRPLVVVIICGHAPQMRKLRHYICAYWVFRWQQLYMVDFAYLGF